MNNTAAEDLRPHGSVWTDPHSFLSYSDVADVIWTGSRLLAITRRETYESTVEGPWQLVSRRGGWGIAWTGSRALVATGAEIFTLDGVGLCPFGSWLGIHFTPAQLSDPDVSGFLSDPDDDQLSNLVEYATGTNPASAADALVATVEKAADGYRFRWPLDTGRADVRVTPQSSFNLGVWDALTATPVSGTAGGVRIMESAPFPGQPSVFFRLKVEFLE